MAETLYQYKHAVFLLAFISCLLNVLTAGRPIKLMNEHEVVHKELVKHDGTGSVNLHQRKGSLSGQEQMRTGSFSNSAAQSKEDFRPTSPGFSPGAGHPKAVVTKSSSTGNQHSFTGLKDDYDTLHKTSQIPDNAQHSVSGKETGFDVSSATSEDDFWPTDSGFNPGAGHPKGVVTSNLTEHSVTGFKDDYSNLHKSSHSPDNVQQSFAGKEEMLPTTGYDVSSASSKDAFRPTDPGSSPGVGHPMTVVTGSGIEHSTTDISKDDYRPTHPGHSPGVGHSREVVTGSGIEHSVTGYKDDYRPTQPGHSPGVGHSYQKNNAGQNP